MKYLEWNNAIAEYFFKPENAGQDVYLYITKNDIVDIGRKYHDDKKDHIIWNDYLNELRYGLHGVTNCSYDIINNAKESLKLYKSWLKNNTQSIDGIRLFFPPYIAYLAFFVLPLIEIQGHYNANNYFDRLDEFVARHQLKQKLRNRLDEIDELWADLSSWANDIKYGEYGFFQIKNFINKKWIYVAKPFSQCLLPPKAIRNFTRLFLEANMVPASSYSESDFKNYLLKYGSTILSLSQDVISIIGKSETDELGQSIIAIARKEYDKWTGEVHEQVLEKETKRLKRNNTISSLLLQFKVNEMNETVHFSFRLYSPNDFPEDLKLNNIEINYERSGFSKTIELPFNESFEMLDDFNKWLARFPKKDVRLFASASLFQLSTDYWIEIDKLSKTDWMYLFCSNNIKQLIVNWGHHFSTGNFIEKKLDGLPQNYSLFKIRNPTKSQSDIPLLAIYTDKNINLVGGLKTSFRTYLSDYLPEIEVINSDGNELVYLRYNDSEKDVLLSKDQSRNRWFIPTGIEWGRDFKINIAEVKIASNQLTYKIATTKKASIVVDGSTLPKRDMFGRINIDISNNYLLGNKIIGFDILSQQRDKHLFRGIKEIKFNEIASIPKYEHHEGNVLLAFLSLKNICTTEEFYGAFEFLYSKYSDRINNNENINYSWIKKASLSFYDSLGYIDYEYETKRIVAQPTQVVLVPADKGRKALLVGVRDEDTVNKLIEIAPKHKLQVDIIKQEYNKRLLLPDAISLRPIICTSQKDYGEKYIAGFAREMNIPFNPDDLVQDGFLQFSARISEYEKDLFLNNETSQDDDEWARKVFNPNSLTYDITETSSFNKSFALVEYKYNEYTYRYRFWRENKCYSVDKTWGNYLALWHYNKQVILYDKCKDKLAIPIELPLPKLLAKSVILLSGLAPSFLSIKGRKYRIYENIPYIFAHNLFNKLGQKPIETSL
jgi:hypothetical protein